MKSDSETIWIKAVKQFSCYAVYYPVQGGSALNLKFVGTLLTLAEKLLNFWN